MQHRVAAHVVDDEVHLHGLVHKRGHGGVLYPGRLVRLPGLVGLEARVESVLRVCRQGCWWVVYTYKQCSTLVGLEWCRQGGGTPVLGVPVQISSTHCRSQIQSELEVLAGGGSSIKQGDSSTIQGDFSKIKGVSPIQKETPQY